MTREHWDRAADVALGEPPAWDLPGGIRIVGTPRGPRRAGGGTPAMTASPLVYQCLQLET